MPTMATVLTPIGIDGAKFTYSTAGHTVQEQKVVVSASKAPSGNSRVAEQNTIVSHATKDAEGTVLNAPTSVAIKTRQSIDGQAADLDAVIAIVRDVVNSDEWANAVKTLEPLQG